MKIYFILILFLFINSLHASQPRPEYPRPQFEREQWMNLNGEWTYTFDFVNSGTEKKLYTSKGFQDKIIVPFPPESKLSGVGYTDFIPSIWYHRTIQVPVEWQGKSIILNFGAIYYESEIYIDGKLVSRHFGGSDSFSVDITDYANDDKIHNLVIQAKNNLRNTLQSAGKQSLLPGSWGCYYTRSTGIWQTIWMEAIGKEGMEKVYIDTDIDQKRINISPIFYSISDGSKLIVKVKDGSKAIVEREVLVAPKCIITLPIKDIKLWSPESPYLYDIELSVRDSKGNILDEVKTYAGMRKIHIEGNKIYLNNKPYYQRLVLDQGFYPDGIWTAPNDAALKNDILLSKAAGFNGARLHQKVFEERFHYWADKLGYLTWGEAPTWGMNTNDPMAARNFLIEWTNIVNRDINHPSIVIWTPLNEPWWPDKIQYPRFCEDLYAITKMIDPSRPVNTSSGGVHIKTDIWTVHNYQQDGNKLRDELYNEEKFQQTPNFYEPEHYGNLGSKYPLKEEIYDFPGYNGKIPFLIDEFGGIKYEAIQVEKDAWGYGDAAKTEEEFYLRLESQVDAILYSKEYVWGFCYTQLTDVEQEQNGIYFYDRSPKFDLERIRAIFSKKN